MFEGVSINYLNVLIATIASFVFSWLWYGPLFGKAWMQEMKMSQAQKKKGKKNMGGKMLLGFIGTFVMASVVAVVLELANFMYYSHVLKLIVTVWLGFFVAGGTLDGLLWEGKSRRLFSINSLARLGSLIIISAIVF